MSPLATGGRTAPKNSRIYCCCCPKEAKKGHRYRAGANSLWGFLNGRVNKDGNQFTQNDILCNKCQMQVRVELERERRRREENGGGDVENGGGDVENGGGDVENSGRDVENGGGDVENGGRDVNNGGGDVENGGGDVNDDGDDVGNGGGDIENGGGDVENCGGDVENCGGDVENGGDLVENGDVDVEIGGSDQLAMQNSADGLENTTAIDNSDCFRNSSQFNMPTDPRAMVSASFSESDSQELFNLPKRRAERFELPGLLGIGSSQSFCCVCHSLSGRSVVPMRVSHLFMCETGIWLPPGNRICQEHVVEGRLTEEATHALRNRAKSPATTTASEVAKIFKILTTQSPIQRIDVDRLDTDADYWMLFGVTKSDFEDLYAHIRGHLRDTVNRSSRNALAIFLMKLRLGLTHNLLGWLFGCPKGKVGETFWRVKSILEETFLPFNLGCGHLTREEAIARHDLKLARSIFDIPDGSLPLLFDCTYLYTDEPSDHVAQKKSFCMYKGTHLLKPMTVCFVDGYILDSAGLYYSDASHNDAKILADMAMQLDGISKFIQEGDFFIVDRGFRDMEEQLQRQGYHVKMPACIQKRGKGNTKRKGKDHEAGSSRKRGYGSSRDSEAAPQRQLTTEEANSSKLIMFLRWVVEAAHGRVKNIFKFFDHQIDSNYFRRNCDKKLTVLYQIACAIVNKYRPPLLKDTPEHEVLLQSIQEKLNKPNTLMEIVMEKRLGSIRKAYENVSGRDQLEDFPRLSLEELKTLTATQLPLRKWDRYNEQYLRLDRDYSVSYYTHDDSIIRVKLGSKYKSRTDHMVWIQYSKDNEEEKIKGWYCRCQVGTRTLGCCCHVASVLYYLGYKRHLQPDFQEQSYGSGIIDITVRQAQVQGYAESDDEELLDL